MFPFSRTESVSGCWGVRICCYGRISCLHVLPAVASVTQICWFLWSNINMIILWMMDYYDSLSLNDWINWINKLKLKLKGQHNLILFYFVRVWQTLPHFLCQTVLWGPYIHLRTALLFNYIYISISILYIFNINILCLNFCNKTT